MKSRTSILRRNHGSTASAPVDSMGYIPQWGLCPFPTSPLQTAEPDGMASVLISTDDHVSRWQPADRFHDLFDQQCQRLGERAHTHPALDYGAVVVSYAELAAESNQLARFLHAEEVQVGDHLAILLDRSILAPAAVLAASRLGVSYVPLDAGFPEERIGHIVADSGATGVLTQRRYLHLFDNIEVPVVALDDHLDFIHGQPSDRFEPEGLRDAADPTAYVIYTSGTTGLPKGVPIRHSSICNFLDVASASYGYQESDRVYQGMTIAFDFSVEELWVPLCTGATVVPASSDHQLLGHDLQIFLQTQQITALCCVPTLLATLEPTLPMLRFLLVSGEACPQELIDPWFESGRRILNAYGPTEATVTATWSVLQPGRDITIGGPLPTYSVVVLDPKLPLVLAPGQEGEVCLAGVALSDGYLNRPEQSERAFIDDFIGLPNNPSGHIYRTGDLGRINAENEIEYMGRIDTQVKIRGYRIELEEIESVANALPGVGQCIVQPFAPPGQGAKLVAYLTPDSSQRRVDLSVLDRELRNRLPTYMVPSFYEQLDEFPLLPSTKVDRKALPAPSEIRFVDDSQPSVRPANQTESLLEHALARLLQLDQVSTGANFFADLGADSLTLAGFANCIRTDLGVRTISMKQLYQNPTIAELGVVIAAAQAETTGLADPLANVASGVSTTAPEDLSQRPVDGQQVHVASRLSHLGVGSLQLVAYLVLALVSLLGASEVFLLLSRADNVIELYGSAVLVSVSGLALSSGLFLSVKLLAVGSFDSKPIPLWSTKYFRFWLAKQAIALNPLNLLVGTPAYNTYLRLLGVNVGSGAVVLARPPVCTDLVSIGSNTVIRQNCSFQGYKAEDGFIRPGLIQIGSDALICDGTILDIRTSVGEGAQLGNSSALLEGQAIPDHRVFHGSPAEPTSSTYDRVATRTVPRWLRLASGILRLLSVSLIGVPTALLIMTWGIGIIQDFVQASGGGAEALGLGGIGGVGGAVLSTAAVTTVLFAGSLVFGLLRVALIPRLLHRFSKPQEVHHLFGVQYMLSRAIARFSNSPGFNIMFGDSSLILWYLRLLGFKAKTAVQTGSNFGSEQRHHSPFLCHIEGETIASDGLVFLNNEYSSTSFVSQRVSLPPSTYLGNFVQVPAGAAIGSNCLIGTKTAVPIDGPLRSDVGLLGSPAFEIPRSVERDLSIDRYDDPDVRSERLRRKFRSNLMSLVLYLTRSWILAYAGIQIAVLSIAGVHPRTGFVALDRSLPLLLAAVIWLPSAIVFMILTERITLRFRRLQPLYCSLYDERFWAHERFWKSNYNGFARLFNGTPFKPLILRGQGIRIGKRVFDDGASISEPTLISIGDDCTLNNRSWIMCHSLEDGTFKSDRVKIGRSCTVGVGAFVHYGTEMGDHSSLAADAFFMKGSITEPTTNWAGNPATELAGRQIPPDDGSR